MAPDLNSLPPSPYRQQHAAPSPRRSSELRGPLAASISPSDPQSPTLSFRDHALPAGGHAGGTTTDNTGVGAGPGPLRHPRPLTAADLYMQMEKEQEAVVSREYLWTEIRQCTDCVCFLGESLDARADCPSTTDGFSSLQYVFYIYRRGRQRRARSQSSDAF